MKLTASKLALLATFALAHCELPRVFAPAPDFEEVTQSIASSACVDSKPFLALVLVISHPGNFAKRRAMRNTYPELEVNALGFRRVFVVGTKDGPEHNRRYPNGSSVSPAEESRRFGDLIQLAMADTYDGLLAKTRAALSWAVTWCAHARFLTKLDDDMVVDFYTLAKELAAVDDADADAIRGRLFVNPEYATSYVSGGCYITTPKTIRLLLEGADTTSPFMHYAEDAYFTGVLADKAGVARVDWPAVRHWEGAPHCCADAPSGVVYACQYAVFEDRRGMARAHVHRFKAHGRFCYFFGCDRLEGNVLGREGLVCFR